MLRHTSAASGPTTAQDLRNLQWRRAAVESQIHALEGQAGPDIAVRGPTSPNAL